jgi:hypothetical protein
MYRVLPSYENLKISEVDHEFCLSHFPQELGADRPGIAHEIAKRVFKEFTNDGRVDIAIPYLYSRHRAISAAPVDSTSSPMHL